MANDETQNMNPSATAQTGKPVMKPGDAYEIWSSTYDHDENPTRDLDREVVRKILSESVIIGKHVIEAGCGTGKNTTWFTEKAKSVIAFDLSLQMLNEARRKVLAKNVRFHIHDITKPWPFPAGCCDIVAIDLVLEHVRDIDAVFAEAFKVLRPGGLLFVCELHPDKQKKGTKARFHDEQTGGLVEVEALYHAKDEFLEAGRKTGFGEGSMVDWPDLTTGVSRLLSITFPKK